MPWHFAECLARVLWALPERAFCTCSRPSEHAPRISFPELILILSLSLRHAKSPDRLLAPCSAASKPLGGTPAAASATAMGSTAQTTTTRQLASFDSGVIVVSPWS